MAKTALIPPDEDQPLLLTPLLDLMFLVLIFFALNLSFQPFDNLEVQVPQTENLPSLNEEEQSILVELYAEGDLRLDDERITLTELRDQVVLELDRHQNLKVFVAGDEETQYRLLMKVLDVLTQAGATRIHLITEEE